MLPETQLLLVVVVKALCELGALFLLGQGLLYILAGAKRETNNFYQLFRVLTGPIVRAVRAVTPRAVVERHLPFVAFLLLFWLWVGTVYLKAALCSGGTLVCTG